MSAPPADVDRLARVKLSSAIEPGALRLTGLVSELGADAVLDYLEAAGEVENHWGFTTGHEIAHVDPGKVLEQPAGRGIRFVISGDAVAGVLDVHEHRALVRCGDHAGDLAAGDTSEKPPQFGDAWFVGEVTNPPKCSRSEADPA